MKTTIEWTDDSWNPIRGCSRVSEGCRNCYAEKVAARFSGRGQAYEGLATIKSGPTQGPVPQTVTTAHWTGEVRFIEHKLDEPLRWKRPKRIFVNSMSDLFHENVRSEWIDQIFAVMAMCPRHTFQILTKRPDRMMLWMSRAQPWREAFAAKVASGAPGGNWTQFNLPLPNIWLGVSVEDQKTADERIPLLLQTPAAVRWVSYEPALGPVDFTHLFRQPRTSPHHHLIDWIVAGGESGPGARPAHPDWFRSARDQCQAAGVPFFFKQWGEWAEAKNHVDSGHGSGMMRIGKKKAGRILDGREWSEYPNA